MFRRTPAPTTRTRAWIGLVAAGGLLVALAPGTAQALPSAGGAQAERLAPPPVATRTVTATVHFESGKSYLSSYSQRILVRLMRSLPAGAVVQSTKVIGYVQARTAGDNGRALGTARAVEVRTHLRALGLGGRIDIASGGIFGNTDLSRRAVVTITYTVVQKVPQTIDFTQPEGMTVGDTDMPLTATATSGLGVTVRSTTTSVCQVVGSVGAWQLHAVAPGECDLRATQAGNAGFSAASAVTRTVTIDPEHVSPPAPDSFDVIFDARSGVVDPESVTFTEGDDPIVLPAATRDGYDFEGWWTGVENGSLVGMAGDEYTPTEDVRLYARWTETPVDPPAPATFTVTFHSNYPDGPADTTQQSDGPAELASISFAAPAGRTFAGWATEPGGAVVYANHAQYDFAADEDLYAVYGFKVRLYYEPNDPTNDELWFCSRADGTCDADSITHVALPADSSWYDFLVFPNQNADDNVLDGFEVGLESAGREVYLEGGAAFDPSLHPMTSFLWVGPAQTVRLHVTGDAWIYNGAM